MIRLVVAIAVGMLLTHLAIVCPLIARRFARSSKSMVMKSVWNIAAILLALTVTAPLIYLMGRVPDFRWMLGALLVILLFIYGYDEFDQAQVGAK
jgi:hypothetical protein